MAKKEQLIKETVLTGRVANDRLRLSNDRLLVWVLMVAAVGMIEEPVEPDQRPPCKAVKVPLRKNVLIIILAGYATVLIMFMSVAGLSATLTVRDAYDMLEGPLMALIGGSLAISKDLVPMGDS